MSKFGDNLKAARKAAGMTQKELADAVGAKHNSVSNWEKGLNAPSKDTIEKLCEVLQLVPNELFGTGGLSLEADEFTYALYNEVAGLTPENRKKILEMAQFFKMQQDKE